MVAEAGPWILGEQQLVARADAEGVFDGSEGPRGKKRRELLL